MNLNNFHNSASVAPKTIRRCASAPFLRSSERKPMKATCDTIEPLSALVQSFLSGFALRLLSCYNKHTPFDVNVSCVSTNLTRIFRFYPHKRMSICHKKFRKPQKVR